MTTNPSARSSSRNNAIHIIKPPLIPIYINLYKGDRSLYIYIKISLSESMGVDNDVEKKREEEEENYVIGHDDRVYMVAKKR